MNKSKFQSVHSDLASTSTAACRIPIFSPTRRPQSVSSWRVETPWGWAQITGRLGQQHRDLLDAARMVAEREEWTFDGQMHLLVDPAKLRAVMGGDGVNWPLLMTWFVDLMRTIVDFHVNSQDINGFGGLVSGVVEAKTDQHPSTRPGAWAEGRRFIKISFGDGWSKLLADDCVMKYPLRHVVGLKHGFSQAVARYCLSHTQTRDTVAGLAQKLDAGGRLRVRRSELSADASGLASLGIIIDGDKITCARQQSPGARQQSPGEKPLLSDISNISRQEGKHSLSPSPDGGVKTNTKPK